MQIDHIILAINELDLGVAQFEELTGIKATYGGEHPNSNTHNAIVPMNDRVYIEILAPKKELDTIPEFFKNINILKPIGFAISTDEIELLEKTILDSEFQTKGIEDWSREKPNGDKLEWKLLRINNPALSINPFFISWSDKTTHPSIQKNTMCYLTEFEVTTQYKDHIENILSKNNSKIQLMKIRNGDTPQLKFTLETPKGKVIFK
ncbi:VOC family protein [Aquimarina sp. AU474]|uniref:VOC family protein n=1 Tax=Aquimarina sp. AU474 TaxID=2108529 RepID=UPI001357D99D|nr:VOC family protein [Aquimarina sp. AU474]